MYLVTGNKKKFLEFQTKFSEIKMIDIDLTEIQSMDAYKVIEHKLQEAKNQVDGSFIVEDTSWYLSALNDFPGVYAKDFLFTLGIEKISEIILNFKDHSAYAKTLIGYIDDKGEEYFFEGIVEGKIVAPRGDLGFGFDQIFIPNGSDKTFGEMNHVEKTKYSMRGRAIQKMMEHLNE